MAASNATQNHIANAMDTHQFYVDLLEDYYAWLEEGDAESNALKVVLWKLIKTTINRRRDGEWADLAENIMPPANELEQMIDQPRMQQFEAQLEYKRDEIETAALAFIETIESSEIPGRIGISTG